VWRILLVQCKGVRRGDWIAALITRAADGAKVLSSEHFEVPLPDQIPLDLK